LTGGRQTFFSFAFSSPLGYTISLHSRSRARVSGDKGTAQLGPARSVGSVGSVREYLWAVKTPIFGFRFFILGLCLGSWPCFASRRGRWAVRFAHDFYFGNGMDSSSHKTMDGWGWDGKEWHGMGWIGIGIGICRRQVGSQK
jgi:hypothetical protein